MAKMNGPFEFNGRLGGIVVYKLPGVKELVARSIGTVSNARMKTSPKYARVRENRGEFGGRGTATKWINAALQGQTALPNFGYSSALNKPVRFIQVQDSIRPRGQRAILFSQGTQVLNGFCLTKQRPLNSIILNPVECILSKETLSATVSIPRLLPGTNFFPGECGSMYKIVVTLGIVPDLFYNGDRYLPNKGYNMHERKCSTQTEWYPVKKGSGEQELSLTIATQPVDASFALLLSVGIQFGDMMGPNDISSVPKKGSAMILKMG